MSAREPGRCHCGAPVRGDASDYADVCTQWPICEGRMPALRRQGGADAAPQARAARSYSIGLPVLVTVHDDGSVTYEVDTADASHEVQEVEETDYPAMTVLADSGRIADDHDRRAAAARERVSE